MAKKEFKIPSIADLMGQIKAFNEKHGTSFDESLAEDFIGYWDARKWKRNGKKMASVAGSLYTWMRNAKEYESRKNQAFYKKEDCSPEFIENTRKYYDENPQATFDMGAALENYYKEKQQRNKEKAIEMALVMNCKENVELSEDVIDCEIIELPKNISLRNEI